MSLINVREKTIQAKIVYYGTALSGKTTSLKHVHRVIDPDGRVELVSLNTEGDRTFFFDFLPIPLGNVHGYQLRFQAFTVPGQVKYHLTRRYVLRGADAVIFVADSSPSAAEDNRVSLESLRENLVANGIDPKSVPIWIQYNKRDAPDAVPVAEMRAALNPDGLPDMETVATTGTGVFEAFSGLCGETVERLAREYRIGRADEARREVERRLLATLLTWHGLQAGRAAADHDALFDAITSSPSASGTVTSLANAVDAGARSAVIEVSSENVPDVPDAEHLLEHAVQANIESARLVSELTETRRRLSDHVRHLATLHQTGVLLTSELDPDRLLGRVLSSVLQTVDTVYGSVLLTDAAVASLREKLVQGLQHDPLVARLGTDADLLRSLSQRKPFVVQVDAGPEMLEAAATSCPMAALVAPLVHQGEVLGALAAYVLDRPLDQDLKLRLKFLGAVASQASVAIVNARLYARVEAFNRELEKKVAERTQELERALAELRQLDRLKDDFLATMSHELLTPLQSIGSAAEILTVVAREEGPQAADERAEFAGVVQRESGRLTGMLQSVLDMSQLEAGDLTFDASPIPLREAVLESYQRLRGVFRASHTRLKIRVEENMPSAKGDARWFGRVLDALLSNAVKFGPAGADVIVTIRRDLEQARIEVRDDGPGVPESLRQTIFQKFKQVGDVLTDKPPGLGLGLPMARTILTRLGGRIWHEPAPQGGSVFHVTLPLAAVPVPA